MRILALADDLTGALETGAKFAAAGLRALVTTESTLQPAGLDDNFAALVIDTETRHAPLHAAAARVRGLAAAVRERGVELVYKKTDSTLRGNIGAELGALLEAFDGTPVLYAPAYPEVGRTVRRGVLLVHGVPVSETAFARDALNPVTASFIPDALATGCAGRVRLAERGTVPAEPAVYVYDGESSADVAAVARVLVEMQGARLAAGPGAFAGAIAAELSAGEEPRIEWPRITHCVVVNGSRHPVSTEQVRQAVGNGWREIEGGECASGWVILQSAGAGSEVEFAASVGEAVRDIVTQSRPDALVVFGGDTAFGILRALGFPPLEPIGEALPGVPVSRFQTGGRTMHLVTKAGGFGEPGLLDSLRARLCGS